MDRIQVELQRMPKEPAEQVVTSVAAQARAVLAAGVSLLVAAGALYCISRLAAVPNQWLIAAGVFAALAPTPLLTGALMAFWCGVQGRKRRELAAGYYYVRWVYDDAQWTRHCSQSESRSRKILWILIGFVLLGSAVFGAIVHLDDGRLFLGSVASHYAVVLGIGGVAGCVVGVFCQRLAHVTQRLKQTRTPQSLIGPGGVYITGQFWPTDTFGHHLISAQIGNSSANHVEFLFQVKTNQGWNETTVAVPIPPGQQQVAAALVAIFREQLVR